MKKLIAVSVLFTLLATAAFAQFRANLLLDFFPEVLTMTNPTGDWNSHGHTAVPYWGEGRRDILSSSSLFRNNALYLDLRWISPDQNAEAYVRVDGRGMVDAANNSFLARGSQGANLHQLLEATFEDWHFRGTVGMFTGFLGNTPNRGKTGGAARFVGAGTGINPEWLDRYLMWNMGFVAPTYHSIATLAPYGHLGTHSGAPWMGGGGNFMETNNFNRRAEFGRTQTLMPYFMLSTAVLPGLLSIDIAGDMSGFTPGNPDVAGDPNSFRRFGGGARASLDLVDLLTLDVIYRFHGGDPNTLETERFPPNPAGQAEPDNAARGTHVAGFVTRLHLIDTLGISLGYSVMIVTEEDTRISAAVVHEKRHPVLHGIDLRLNFNAIDRLAITLNNNVSFSVFRGTNDANVIDRFMAPIGGYFGAGVPHNNTNGREIRQNYIGLYNILGIRFALTDNMAVNLHLQNTLRRFNTNDNSIDGQVERTVTRFNNQFIGQGIAEYGLTNNVLVGGGLGFIFNHSSRDISGAQAAPNYGIGTFTFSVPLRLRMTF